MGEANAGNIFPEDYLSEEFEMSSTSERDFQSVIEGMARRTRCKVVDPKELCICSLLGPRMSMAFDGKEEAVFPIAAMEPDFADMRFIIPDNPEQCYFRSENANVGYLKIQSLIGMGIPANLIDEIEAVGFYLQYRGRDAIPTLIPSKAFLSTFCKKLGIGKMNEGIDPIKNLYLASRMREAEPFVLVYREEKDYGKAFCCFSKKAVYTDQSVIFDFKELLSSLSRVSVHHWRVNHFITTVWFSFDEMAAVYNDVRVAPGVRLSLSDVGDSSYILQNAVCVDDGGILMDGVVSQKHGSLLEVADMVGEYARKEYPKLRSAMNAMRLLDLCKVEDLYEEVRKLVKELMLPSAFGQGNYKQFQRSYLPERKVQATALDVVMFLLKIPGMVSETLKPSVAERVALSLGQVFHTKWMRTMTGAHIRPLPISGYDGANAIRA